MKKQKRDKSTEYTPEEKIKAHSLGYDTGAHGFHTADPSLDAGDEGEGNREELVTDGGQPKTLHSRTEHRRREQMPSGEIDES